MNKTYSYSFKYPQTWILETNSRSEDTEFRFQLGLGEIVTGTIFDKTTPSTDTDTQKTITLPNNKELLVVYAQCLGPGCGFGSLDISTFTKFLSTFKLVDSTDKVKILPTSSWVEYKCGKISYKLPSIYLNQCNDNPDGTQDVLVTGKGSSVPTANIMVRSYDGGSRRQYWIDLQKASSDEVAKYLRFQETQYGTVVGLDVFGSGNWWQGGYSSPILITSGKTIVAIYGGRNFNDETGEIVRWDITDTIASTIKFIN